MAYVRRSQGLPSARHSQFQLVPTAMDTPQDTGEPISQAGGTSVKTCLGNGKKPLRKKNNEAGAVAGDPQWNW